MIKRFASFNESFVLNDVRIDIDREDSIYDIFKITAIYNNETIGVLSMEYTLDDDGYLIMVDVTREQYNTLFPDDKFVTINRIDVYNYRQSGVSKLLLKTAIDKIKHDGFHRVYLNASPLDARGADLATLVKLYKSFGFEAFNPISHNANNVEMFLIL